LSWMSIVTKRYNRIVEFGISLMCLQYQRMVLEAFFVISGDTNSEMQMVERL
jgi:hypothetical protein